MTFIYSLETQNAVSVSAVLYNAQHTELCLSFYRRNSVALPQTSS